VPRAAEPADAAGAALTDPDRVRTFYRPPWRIRITVRSGLVVPIPLVALADAAARALAEAGAPTPAAVDVLLSGDRELSALNDQAMGRAEPTDVLSFPLLPPPAFPPHTGQDPAVRARHPADAFVVPEGRRTELGDLAISVDRAREQAEQGRGGQTGDVRWSPADELRLLVTHGVLHLCGWDHAHPDEERAMRALERELLDATPPSSASS
jgi:probable rRNA maturation factor